MRFEAGLIALAIFVAAVALFLWDQRRIRRMRASLRVDPQTGEYLWTDLKGKARRDKVHPARFHDEKRTGGAWGDGAGPDPQG